MTCRRLAILRVDLTMLRDMLGLPETCEIEEVFQDRYNGEVNLKIASTEFYEVPPGQVIPNVDAEYGDGKFKRFIK